MSVPMGSRWRQRIEGEPAHPPGSRIAHLVRNPSVGYLMDDDRVEPGDRNEDKRERVRKEQADKSHIPFQYHIKPARLQSVNYWAPGAPSINLEGVSPQPSSKRRLPAL